MHARAVDGEQHFGASHPCNQREKGPHRAARGACVCQPEGCNLILMLRVLRPTTGQVQPGRSGVVQDKDAPQSVLVGVFMRRYSGTLFSFVVSAAVKMKLFINVLAQQQWVYVWTFLFLFLRQA